MNLKSYWVLVATLIRAATAGQMGDDLPLSSTNIVSVAPPSSNATAKVSYTLTYQQQGNLVYLCPGILNLVDQALPVGYLRLLNGARPQLFEVTLPTGKKIEFTSYASWRGRMSETMTWGFGDILRPTSMTAPAFDLAEQPAGNILFRWKINDTYSNYISVENKKPPTTPSIATE